MRVAYVMSRFPRLTETFILAEILALQEQGVDVQLYPLLRERADAAQPEALPLVAAAHYQPFISAPILRSNLRLLRRAPRRYLGTLAAVIRATWRSPNFLVGALGIFPKTVHNALDMARTGVAHVHCHFANHPAIAGFVIRRLTGIPYSFTAHGSDLHKDRTGLPHKVREAAFVVAISEYNRRLIVEESAGRWADRVDVIHCGVRTDRFQPATGERSAAQRPLRILCVGTLHEVKGQAHLVEACRILAARGIAFECALVGDGPHRPMLQRHIVEKGLNERVRLLGSRKQDEIVALLADSDVLVAPSVPTASGQREGIPVVLMEAMSSGVPVVASDLSGIPELVRDGESGLLTPPGDAVAIAAALERLARDDDLRQRLGRAGRQKVLADFDVAANARILARRFAETAREAA